MVWQILKILRLSPAIHLSKSISQIVWQILNLVLFMPVNHSPISISQIVWQLLEIGLLGDVKTFYPKSNLISKSVLAKKSLIYDSNRIQAQEARKHTEEIPWCGNSWCYRPSMRNWGKHGGLCTFIWLTSYVVWGYGRQVRTLQKWVVKASLVYCVLHCFVWQSVWSGEVLIASKPKRTVTPYSVCLPNLCQSGLPVWV